MLKAFSVLYETDEHESVSILLYCCMYRGSSEKKCPVSGAKRLIAFENNVPATPNLTDSVSFHCALNHDNKSL